MPLAHLELSFAAQSAASRTLGATTVGELIAHSDEDAEADDGALSIQVLQEFYVQATRSGRAAPLPHDVATGLVETWFRFRVQETTREVMAAAFATKAARGLSYRGAAVVAAARALGCSELLSEDMNHGQLIDGVAIINPFR